MHFNKKLPVHKGGSALMDYIHKCDDGLCKTLSPPYKSALFTAVNLLSVMRLLRTERQRETVQIHHAITSHLYLCSSRAGSRNQKLSHRHKCSREVGLSELLSVSRVWAAEVSAKVNKPLLLCWYLQPLDSTQNIPHGHSPPAKQLLLGPSVWMQHSKRLDANQRKREMDR